MFDIDKNNKITITRGDTGNGILFINCGTKEKPVQYLLTENDKVQLFVFKIGNTSPILTKEFTNLDLDEEKNIKIRFNSSDTLDLPTAGCEYVYSVKVITNNGLDVSTIINKVAFIVED